MLIKQLSLISAIVAFTNAVSAATATTPAAGVSTPAPVIPLPAFSGKFSNNYPPILQIAATNTPLVAKWLSELNMTAVPNIPVVAVKNGAIVTPSAIPASACDWTKDNCVNKDIISCPKGSWGLTYDDGPTEFSEKLYDFLDQTDQKATLFYIGSNIMQNWQAARRACGAGHQIAVHTWSHQMSTSLTNEQFVAEVKYTEMAIKELCGFTPTYFRPPYGDIDNRIRNLLVQMGYTNVIWDLDTNDWEMDPTSKQTAVTPATIGALFDGWVAKAPTDTTGHVCLEHELYQSTVDTAIANLPKLQKTWKTMPVSACMNDPHPYQEKNITLATISGAKTGVTSGTVAGAGNGTSAIAPAPTASKNSASSMTAMTGVASAVIAGAVMAAML